MNRIALAGVVLALVATGPVRAGDAVPVYTNADLDRMFGKAPEPSAKPYVDADADWQRVGAFLDREYARVDADRKHDIDRASVRVETREENEFRGWPAGAWWGSYPYYGGYYRTNPYGGYGHPRAGGPYMTNPAPGARGSGFGRIHGSEFRIKSGGFRGHAR